MCDACLDSETVFFLLLIMYGAIFGAVSMVIAMVGRPWVGLILTPPAFILAHHWFDLSADFPATVLPALLLTGGLWRFGCAPGTHVLRRWVRIITFAVGFLCLLPLLVEMRK